MGRGGREVCKRAGWKPGVIDGGVCFEFLGKTHPRAPARKKAVFIMGGLLEVLV